MLCCGDVKTAAGWLTLSPPVPKDVWTSAPTGNCAGETLQCKDTTAKWNRVERGPNGGFFQSVVSSALRALEKPNGKKRYKN